MTHEDVRRALARVAHEILERNRGAEDLVLVRQLVRQQPDLTLQELCDAVDQQRGVRVSVPTMCIWLQRLGLVRKKVSARQ